MSPYKQFQSHFRWDEMWLKFGFVRTNPVLAIYQKSPGEISPCFDRLGGLPKTHIAVSGVNKKTAIGTVSAYSSLIIFLYEAMFYPASLYQFFEKSQPKSRVWNIAFGIIWVMGK